MEMVEVRIGWWCCGKGKERDIKVVLKQNDFRLNPLSLGRKLRLNEVSTLMMSVGRLIVFDVTAL